MAIDTTHITKNPPVHYLKLKYGPFHFDPNCGDWCGPRSAEIVSEAEALMPRIHREVGVKYYRLPLVCDAVGEGHTSETIIGKKGVGTSFVGILEENIYSNIDGAEVVASSLRGPGKDNSYLILKKEGKTFKVEPIWDMKEDEEGDPEEVYVGLKSTELKKHD